MYFCVLFCSLLWEPSSVYSNTIFQCCVVVKILTFFLHWTSIGASCKQIAAVTCCVLLPAVFVEVHLMSVFRDILAEPVIQNKSSILKDAFYYIILCQGVYIFINVSEREI